MPAAFLDFKYALRTLRRRRGYAVLAAGTLALGIGAATTIYGVVDGVLLRPLPFAASDRLVVVYRTFPHWRDQDALQARWDKVWFSWWAVGTTIESETAGNCEILLVCCCILAVS